MTCFSEDVTEAQTVCALRFLGYEYERSADLVLSGLIEPIVKSRVLHTDQNANFAAFFGLQRFLHKWGASISPNMPTNILPTIFCFCISTDSRLRRSSPTPIMLRVGSTNSWSVRNRLPRSSESPSVVSDGARRWRYELPRHQEIIAITFSLNPQIQHFRPVRDPLPRLSGEQFPFLNTAPNP